MLKGTDRHGTEWRLGWIPLGGYVKMHGQETPEDAPPEVRAAWQAGRTFHGKSVGSRAIVVAAGPVANFLLAILLFAGLFMTIGQPVGGTGVGAVVEASAAAQAGLRAGRRDRRARRPEGQPVRAGAALHPAARRPADRACGCLRDGAELTRHRGARGARGRAGQGRRARHPGRRGTVRRLDPFSALVAGTVQTADITWQTLAGNRRDDHRPAQHQGAGRADPHRRDQRARRPRSASRALVNLMAVLSVSLGLLNLFPIPVLDGGHLMFYAAEAIRGRPLPPQGAGIRLPRRIRAADRTVPLRFQERHRRGRDRAIRLARLLG